MELDHLKFTKVDHQVDIEDKLKEHQECQALESLDLDLDPDQVMDKVDIVEVINQDSKLVKQEQDKQDKLDKPDKQDKVA